MNLFVKLLFASRIFIFSCKRGIDQVINNLDIFIQFLFKICLFFNFSQLIVCNPHSTIPEILNHLSLLINSKKTKILFIFLIKKNILIDNF